MVVPSVGKDREELKQSVPAVGNVNGKMTSILENSFSVSYNVKHSPVFQPFHSEVFTRKKGKYMFAQKSVQ